MARCYACPKNLGNGGILTEDGRLLCPICENKEKHSRKPAPAYGTSELWESSVVIPIILVGTLGLLGFIILLLRGSHIEKSVKEKIVNVPVEVIKNVPVEVIKNVPVEVIKEKIVNVPVDRVVVKEVVKEDPEAIAAKKFLVEYLQAIQNPCPPEKVLWNIPSIRVNLYIGKKLTDVLDESSLRTTIELRLRNNGIVIDNDSNYNVLFSVEGIWDKQQTVCSYNATVQMLEKVIVARRGVCKNVLVTSWRDGIYGYAGSKILKTTTQETFESLADELANVYLASNPKK